MSLSGEQSHQIQSIHMINSALCGTSLTNIVRINDRKFIHRFFLTIQVYYCKLNARFMIVNLQHKKERLSYVSMRDYKALCVAVIKCQQHNLIWDKTNR